MTRVVRLRRRGGVVIQNCDVYIGRAITQGGWNLPTSKWANPFTVKQYSRIEAIQKYRTHLLSRPDLLRAIGPELRGRVLGCWCAPDACHGDVLREFAAKTEEELALAAEQTSRTN